MSFGGVDSWEDKELCLVGARIPPPPREGDTYGGHT